jgi:hypothetical protein
MGALLLNRRRPHCTGFTLPSPARQSPKTPENTRKQEGITAADRKPASTVPSAYQWRKGISQLLHHHCPNIECTPSVAVELMVKAAMDPGSSALHRQLLSADEGMTQYSVRYADHLAPLSIRRRSKKC